jgi:Ser/Thr protein kinase RdoA (MazF antagonist)
VKPAEVAEHFDIHGQVVATNVYGAGNVNDTYLGVFRTTYSEERVIIQRINSRVFGHPEWIMRNIRVVTDHVHQRLEQELAAADRVWQLPRIIPCKDGRDFFIDDEGEYWRAFTLIASTRYYETVANAEHALEVGTVLGQFHRLISDIAPDSLLDTLPGFHVTPGYLDKYDRTMDSGNASEVFKSSAEARRLRDFVKDRRDLVNVLEEAMANGELVTRPIHGDPKVTNIMIDDLTGRGTSIIDLDTVRPGLVQYDFGDAMRSLCNPAGEETLNLNEVVFDTDLCAALSRGYMKHAKAFLSDNDRRYLYESIRLLAFELGLRFFEDHLSGDHYFKIRQKGQNLNRARVQFRLCESIETRERQIRSVLKNCE